jgi:hypothetical protein
MNKQNLLLLNLNNIRTGFFHWGKVRKELLWVLLSCLYKFIIITKILKRIYMLRQQTHRTTILIDSQKTIQHMNHFLHFNILR